MGDYFSEIADEGQQLMADYIEETIWDMLNEADIPPMFADMIDLCAVNWQELADHYTTEADFQAEVA
jgi:preprotein translocase subunit SecB